MSAASKVGVNRPKRPKTGGRQKGTQNKVSGELKEMILGALNTAGGEKYLVTQARDNPGPFLTLLGKVLPTTLQGDKDKPLFDVEAIRKGLMDKAAKLSG